MPPVRKLTDEDVLAIRARLLKGKSTQREEAARYGVAQSLICGILRGKARRKAWEGKQGLHTLEPQEIYNGAAKASRTTSPSHD